MVMVNGMLKLPNDLANAIFCLSSPWKCGVMVHKTLDLENIKSKFHRYDTNKTCGERMEVVNW